MFVDSNPVTLKIQTHSWRLERSTSARFAKLVFTETAPADHAVNLATHVLLTSPSRSSILASCSRRAVNMQCTLEHSFESMATTHYVPIETTQSCAPGRNPREGAVPRILSIHTNPNALNPLSMIQNALSMLHTITNALNIP